MTTDGGLDRWHVDGPVVWHSETASLGYWYAGGIYSDYKAAEAASGKPVAQVIWI